MSGLLARLIAAGTPPELIEEVAMLVARARIDSEAIETRRTKDRERQASRRHVTSRDTADVTDTPAPSPSSSPDPSNNPTPTRIETPRARKGTRLSDDWRPATLNPETVSGDVVKRRGQEWARRALESFRNHWRSANGPTATKRDWQAAWANWVIEQDNRDGRRTGNERLGANGRGNSTSGMGPTVDAAERFLARRGVG